MRATNVRLADDMFAALEAEAKRLGVSTSELVREAVILRLVFAAAHRAGREDVAALLDELRRRER